MTEQSNAELITEVNEKLASHQWTSDWGIEMLAGILAEHLEATDQLAEIRGETIRTYERENADWERRVHIAERKAAEYAAVVEQTARNLEQEREFKITNAREADAAVERAEQVEERLARVRRRLTDDLCPGDGSHVADAIAILDESESRPAPIEAGDREALGYWAISGDAFLAALHRAHDGEDPDMVYAELYVNSDHEEVEGDE